MSLRLQREALRKRLNGYWKMELGNVALLPVCMLGLAWMQDYPLGLLTWISLVPMCGLLLLGGFYWRAKLLQIQGSVEPLRKVMPVASLLQIPFAVSSFAVCMMCCAAWVVVGLSASLGDLITASIAALLALLEYVNYYHRQLQHFDHAADVKRLKEGKGFRPSQMAVDLKRFQRGTL